MSRQAPSPVEKDAQIRAAGVVQAVIASGAPAEEWMARAAYGLSLASYMKGRLLGNKPTAPKIPDSIKERE